MIQELKRTPITFDDVDGWEVLMVDDNLTGMEELSCYLCMYYEWCDKWEELPPCDIVHGCVIDKRAYFIFEPK